MYPLFKETLYRNRENRRFCKERGIRISGPRLGRPPKETNKAVIRQDRSDAAGRNAIEGKFGEGKRAYGLGCIMARLKESSETVIFMSIFCMNISRRLRELLRLFYKSIFEQFFVVDFHRFICLRLVG